MTSDPDPALPPPHIPDQAGFLPACDSRIEIMGRAERRADGGVRVGYPGVTFRLKYSGPSPALVLDASGPNTHLEVCTEDGMERRIRLSQGPSVVPLGDAGGDGIHSVEIVHQTEYWMGSFVAAGFSIPARCRLLTPEPPPEKRLLFIGDSVTCGEGIDRLPGGEKESYASSNARQSFGMRIARACRAQCHLVSYGGRGLVRDWQGRRDVLTAPQFFDLAVPDETGAPAWNHETYPPDLVFVSLGTNDFSLGIGDFPVSEDFIRTYVAFARRICACHPRATVLLTEGAIVNDPDDPARPQKTVLRACLAETALRLADPRISAIPSKRYPGNSFDAHPTGEQHAAMARDFEPVIRAAAGW